MLVMGENGVKAAEDSQRQGRERQQGGGRPAPTSPQGRGGPGCGLWTQTSWWPRTTWSSVTSGSGSR